MIAAILQPGYLPWLGFFEQMHRADVFVMYDDVQYDKHSWRNRNRIKTPQGPQWLTVPVLFSLAKPTLIKDVPIDNGQPWQKKHGASIRQSYAKAPFLTDYCGQLEDVYGRRFERLIDLDMCLVDLLRGWLGMSGKPVRFSSELNVEGDRIERLIRICKAVGADVFYEGAAGSDYIDPATFAAQGIRVEFQDYHHPAYSQLHGEFVPYMSVIDLLFNHGPHSLSILTGKTSPPEEAAL